MRFSRSWPLCARPDVSRRQAASIGRPNACLARLHSPSPGLARAADVGSDCVRHARRRDPDLARQCRASVALAMHAGVVAIHIGEGNGRNIGIAVGRERRPMGCERAACAARAAGISFIVRHRGRVGHRCPGRNAAMPPPSSFGDAHRRRRARDVSKQRFGSSVAHSSSGVRGSSWPCGTRRRNAPQMRSSATALPFRSRCPPWRSPSSRPSSAPASR